MDDRSSVFAELDRVRANFAKVGGRTYIRVRLGLEEVKLLGPPREHPRRSWLGPELACTAVAIPNGASGDRRHQNPLPPHRTQAAARVASPHSKP
jgi:hypothetical protein